MSEYKKTLPKINIETKAFWDACRRHELIVQRCEDCGAYHFYPCEMCNKCNSMNVEWRKVSGKGRVYTWTVVCYATDPEWAADVPYVVAVVELNEQSVLLMMGRLVDIDPEDVIVEMPVEVTFNDVTDEITLPQWRPALNNKGNKKI